jgi:hypothetical protein
MLGVQIQQTFVPFDDLHRREVQTVKFPLNHCIPLHLHFHASLYFYLYLHLSPRTSISTASIVLYPHRYITQTSMGSTTNSDGHEIPGDGHEHPGDGHETSGDVRDDTSHR